MTLPKVNRNNRLLKMRLQEGKTFQELGDYFGISRNQAEAIFKRMLSKIKVGEIAKINNITKVE